MIVSIVIDPERLRRELARRGLSASDLSHEARISGATISAALAGKPIAASSLQLLGEALLRRPVLAVIDSLLPPEPPPPMLG
jgi:transcriptional regulator with XRE-family HTH domain